MERGRTLVAAAVAAVAMAACAGGGQEEIPTPVAAAWTAEILPIGDAGANGFATITILGAGETRVNATLTGVAPDTEYPWSLWTGACGEDGERVGDPADYPVMRSNDRGSASATATLPLTLPVDATHRLEVYAPDGSTVGGCGELR